VALRNGYRAGIIHCTEGDYQQGVAQTFRILAQTGGDKLVGKSSTLSDGTFWPGYRFPTCPKK
jgi:NitT/TauT family transport system substrate-binding protein